MHKSHIDYSYFLSGPKRHVIICLKAPPLCERRQPEPSLEFIRFHHHPSRRENDCESAYQSKPKIRRTEYFSTSIRKHYSSFEKAKKIIITRTNSIFYKHQQAFRRSPSWCGVVWCGALDRWPCSAAPGQQFIVFAT